MWKRKTLNAFYSIDKKPKYVRKEESVFVGDEPIEEKEMILNFLEAYYPNFATSGKVIDHD